MSRKTWLRLALSAVVVWMPGFLGSVSGVAGDSPAMPASAVITAGVNTFDDVMADDGVCTLREGIKAANTNTASGSSVGECTAGMSGSDSITLQAGTYRLSIPTSGYANDINSGDLNVTESLVIRGAGAGQTIIDADGIDRVVQVVPGVSLRLEDLTVTGGVSPAGAASIGYGGGSGAPGGGIYNNGGSLTLVRCVVRGNFAGSGGAGGTGSDSGGAGGPGGGIASVGGTLELDRTTVAYNQAGHGGSGGSYAGDGGDGGRGGGIYVTGEAAVAGSAVHNNGTGNGGNNGGSGGTAGEGGFGGGISVGGTGDLALQNSTVSSNVTGNGYGGTEGTGGYGGGICNMGGQVTLQHATVSYNRTGDGFLAGNGGGLWGSSGSTNSTQNSLLSDNVLGTAAGGSSPSGPDCVVYTGELTSVGYNLVGDVTDCTITGDLTGNLTPGTAGLLSLADNGGGTSSHALGAGSGAEDHIPAGTSGCGTTFPSDQRGQPRPANTGCDVGAVEMQATETTVEVTGLTLGDTTAVTGTGALVTLNAGDPGTIVVNRQETAPENTKGLKAIPVHWNITPSQSDYDLDLGLCYTEDEASGLSEAELGVYRWDETLATWAERDGVLDTTNNCITATSVLTLSTWTLAVPQTSIYVDADAGGANDGTSWDDAYTDLQDALTAAAAGDEIWVAASTYKPTDSTDRAIAFEMVEGVGIYGGFAGSETERSERDWDANPTVLSGDIGTAGSTGDNSYHVVVAGSTVTETAVLDGFVVTGGRASVQSFESDDSRGGGVFVDGGSPMVRNCTLTNNYAWYDGGGMAVWAGGDPTVADTTFVDNSVTYYGGGLSSWSGTSPWIVNVRFLGNRSISLSGGGAVNFQSTPTYVNTIFSGNAAAASGYGGGVYNWEANGAFRNVTFRQNTAYWGGGMANSGCSPTVVNGILWGNTAGYQGAQIYNTSGAATVTYSIVQGGYTGVGNIDADAAFVDADGADDIAGTLDDDLSLLPGSPAIDAGRNDGVPADVADLDDDGDTGEATPVDLGRDPRLVDEPETDTGLGTPPLVDMGAYEKQRTCWVRLNDDATDYATVQAAVDASSASTDVVKVAGLCGGVEARQGLTQTVLITKTLTLRGGYTRAFSDPPDPETNPTMVAAGGQGRVIAVISGGDPGITPVIEGLRITGGDAAGQGGAGPDDDGGGGIFVEGGAPTVRNCWIYGNTADIGGGVLLGDTTGALTENEIYENSAGDGGGVGTGFGSPSITGNEIYSNTGEYCGGGLNIFETDGTFAGNVVRNNEADLGGGLCVVDSGLALTSNEILTNTANGGGGLTLDNVTAAVTGNLIRGNDADTGSGGGVVIEGEASDGAVLSDNEIADNSAHWVGAGVFVNGASPTLTGNWIHHNTGNEGSGITSSWSEAVISGNTIEHNSANWRGGGLALRDESSLRLEANLIRYNSAAWDGGGVFAENSAPVLTNNAIFDNGLTENGYGDGLCVRTSIPRLLHNTVSNNSGGKGYGLFVGAASTATLTNTIVVSQTTGVFVEGDGTATIDGVLWYGNGADVDGGGTIVEGNAYSGDPAFDADGYHLTRTSAAIDHGVAADVTIDIDGDSRPLDHGRDLGADEYAGDLVPPEVVGREPGPGATDVAVDAAVVITFSEAIDRGSFAYTVAPDPGGWSAAWRAGDMVVTLSHLDLAASTTYTVTVSAADDPAGNSLTDAPVTWAFTTGEDASHEEAPAVTSGDSTQFVVGAAGSFTVTATGIPTPTLEVTGGLPGGVAFMDNGDGTASLAGTAAAGTGGVYSLAITASNGVAPDATQAFTLTVMAKLYLPLVVTQ